MYLNLREKRENYFADATTTDILRSFIPSKTSNKTPITIEDVRGLNLQGRVITGTVEGNLDDILQHREYHVNSLKLVDIIEHLKDGELKDGELLVLPSEYRLPAEEVRQCVVYDLGTLVNLDSIHVKRKLLGETARSRKMSQRQKQEAQWSPEKVVKTAFDLLHEQKDELAENIFTSYCWFGKDNHRRVVSLYRAIQGAELRAFQVFAEHKLLIPVLTKELRIGKSARSGYQDELTAEEREKKQDKIKLYTDYLQRTRPEGRSAGDYIRCMDVSFTDLIEQESRAFAHRGGRIMRVPSRSRPRKEPYNVKLTGIPFLPQGSPLAYSQVWEMAGSCYCDDKLFRSDRRRKELHLGNDEEFFCSHEIAALHTLRKTAKDDAKEHIDFLPFVLPTAEMMRYVDHLREQAIIVEHKDPETKRASKRALNHTEIERLLWARVMARGYDACFTTDIGRFVREKRPDPHFHLIRFRT